MIPFEQDGMQVTAESVRESLGDFSQDETKPAKRAARMARKPSRSITNWLMSFWFPHGRGVYCDQP